MQEDCHHATLLLSVDTCDGGMCACPSQLAIHSIGSCESGAHVDVAGTSADNQGVACARVEDHIDAGVWILLRVAYQSGRGRKCATGRFRAPLAGAPRKAASCRS